MCVPNSAASGNLVRWLPPSPFTHPRVGQAEARAHFCGHRPNGKENSSKNSLKTGAASTLCLIRYLKEKELSFPLLLRRRISRLVWPCESLCDLVGKGSHANTSCPSTRRCEPFAEAVFPHLPDAVAHRTRYNDNILITCARGYGYPPKELVWCGSAPGQPFQTGF